MGNWRGKTPLWRSISRWSLHDLLAKDCEAAGLTDRAKWHRDRMATQAAADIGTEAALEGMRVTWYQQSLSSENESRFDTIK